MQRRTKIIATLGSATDSKEKILALIEAGTDLVRLNFSIGLAKEHKQRVQWVREYAKQLGKHIAIIGDLQGPKIRIGQFIDGCIELTQDQQFILSQQCDSQAGNQQQVFVDYNNLCKDSQIGDHYLLGDGRIKLKVIAIEEFRLICQVVQAGKLTDKQNINKLGGGLSTDALTEKDKQDIQLAADIGCDYIAVSFPKDASDIEQARHLLQKANSQAELIAKIERAEVALNETILQEVIKASDAVMVARGDLGVEIGDAALIGIQKHIIKQARRLDKCVITATQMMESMISNPTPTRAEVFDVANAVLDGTDAVLLSSETAEGQYPIETVCSVDTVCQGAEKQKMATTSSHRIDRQFQRIDEAVAMSVMYAANHLKGVKAIICLTESGSTPLWMSRISSGLPIYALTRHTNTLNRVALYRGVQAIPFDVTKVAPNQMNRFAMQELKQRKIINDGDLVLISKGDHMGVHGGTNSIKIVSCSDI